MKKLLRFTKGLDTIHIPFGLGYSTDWESTVVKEMEDFNKKYKYSKKARLGFTITETYAELVLRK